MYAQFDAQKRKQSPRATVRRITSPTNDFYVVDITSWHDSNTEFDKLSFFGTLGQVREMANSLTDSLAALDNTQEG